MNSKVNRLGGLAAILSVLVWSLCAVPLAGQSQALFQGRQASRLQFHLPPVDAGSDQAQVTSAAGVAAGVESGQSVENIAETADGLLQQMSLTADVIFAGQVTAVRRPGGFAGSAQAAAEGIVEIDLRVDQSLRGPPFGSTYTVREWSGLWAGQFDRYRVGQRLLLFLYAAGTNGLSAPVHGAEGAIPLRGSGVAPGPNDMTAGAAEWLVDLRWLQAQVPRRGPFHALAVRSPAQHDPRHGIVSERVGDRPQVETDSLLVFEPALRPAALPVETQPLSHVLALCLEAISDDTLRRRNATP